MIIIGLTGSIGMGKTVAAGQFRALGVPVFEADACVHQLMGKGGRAVAPVSALFPESYVNGVINRTILGKIVFKNNVLRRRLEAIIHPMVREEEQRFLRHNRQCHEPLCVIDIPLLFETGEEYRCDYIVVVTAPYMIQKQRVMRRTEMTLDRFETILKLQVADAEKKRRADGIIHTGLGKRHSLCQISGLIRELT